MPKTTVQNWNGIPVEVVRSRRGVTAFLDYRDNLIRDNNCAWPPPELIQKLCRSDRVSAFLREDQALLENRLGYYTDLQSIHSEDAIQWSFFGPIVYAEADLRVAFSNWLAVKLGLAKRNQQCTIALWRRIPHPDTLGSGGPELDLLIVGDEFAVVVESKWRSGEGRWQGSTGNQSQLQLRQQFLEKCGASLLEKRELMVLYVVLDGSQKPSNDVQSAFPVKSLEWAELCEWESHPNWDEFQRYYEWKCNLVARGVGVPAPGRRLINPQVTQ